MRRPFCPETYLSEWDRKGLDQAATIVRQTVIALLAIEHSKAFAAFPALMMPDDEPGVDEENNGPIAALAPFALDGDMRPTRLAVAVAFDNSSLRVVPM